MKSRRSSARTASPCWVYFIECRGGGIYVGVTDDVEKRYALHCKGRGSVYTRLKPPLRLLAKKLYASRREALAAERDFKRMSPWEKRRWAIALGGLLSRKDPPNSDARVVGCDVDHVGHGR